MRLLYDLGPSVQYRVLYNPEAVVRLFYCQSLSGALPPRTLPSLLSFLSMGSKKRKAASTPSAAATAPTPSAAATAPTKEARVAALQSWLLAAGGTIHPSLRFGNDGCGGTGVFAKHHIAAESDLFVVPRQCIISLETVRLDRRDRPRPPATTHDLRPHAHHAPLIRFCPRAARQIRESCLGRELCDALRALDGELADEEATEIATWIFMVTGRCDTHTRRTLTCTAHIRT